MYRNHADQTFIEIESEDLENDRFFYRFLRFPPSIVPRDLFDEMGCTTGEECFQYRIEEGSQFFEIDDS